MTRYAKKVDSNHGKIRDELRAIFGEDSVKDCSKFGDDFPDLMVGVRGFNFLFEVKPPGGKLSPGQRLFHAEWRRYGQIDEIHSTEEALAIIQSRTV